MSNPLDQVGAVSRALESTERDGAPARVLSATRTYPVPALDVWDALTDRDRIARWFLPVSGDLRLGGRYQLEGNAGGTIERCDPPNGFSATWESGGQVSWIEVSLAEQPDGRIRLVLEHIAHVSAELWAQFGPGAVGVGWDGALMGLALHLSGAGPLDPQQAAAWMASDDGRQFFTLSRDRKSVV